MTDPVTKTIQWEPIDLAFLASGPEANPYALQDLPFLQVTFTHECEAEALAIEGFWDGGQDWRVRFAPPSPGCWTWRAASPDPAIDGTKGVIEANAPSDDAIHENPNLKGHLKIDPAGRHFVYADGTPFLMLGDTNWSLNTDRCGLDANGNGPCRTYLEDRKSRAFNTVFTELVEINQPDEEGYPYPGNTAWPGNGDYDELNPAYFQSLDLRMRLLWDMGFVIAAHPTWVGKQIGMPLPVARRLSRYLLARYGAYNLIWSLSGEYQYAYTNDLYPWTPDDWRSLGRDVAHWNAYGHPVSVHPSGRQGKQAHRDWPPESGVASSAGEFHDEPWLDHNWLQTGHDVDRLWRVPQRVVENRDRRPAKPVIHSEGFYENHKDGGATAEQIRYQAWSAFLNGAAGHVYGGAGVWQFHDPAFPSLGGKDRCNSPPPDGTDWRGALAYPGAGQLRHATDLLASLPWWRMEPCRERLLVDGVVPALEDLSAPHCGIIDGEWVVAYVPSGNRGRSLVFDGPDPAGWTAKWLNPADGVRQDADEPVAVEETFVLPQPPTESDWVLVLQKS